MTPDRVDAQVHELHGLSVKRQKYSRSVPL